MKFSDFSLSDSLLAGLNDVNFKEPTPVQKQSIPIVLQGKDLISTAQTGTGKTGAFVIPLMERIIQSNRGGVKALILTPTRELATQIDQEIFAIGYHSGISSATVIGGSDFSVQAKALKAGVDIIVATPGRLIDQNKVVSIDFSKLEFLVLDEADRMLDMGFLPDMKKIISWLPEKRQTLLFSATMPVEIQKLTALIMKNPESVEIERSKPSQQVEQRGYTLLSHQKIPLVKKIFKDLTWESCIIFTSTKKGTDELQRLLKKEGIRAESIHGDRTQDERNRALGAFKNGQVPVIVATDVLARGIDIKGVSIIINYDVPNNTDDYIHRIGRTGRYDKSGIAITFATRRDNRTFQEILSIKGNSIKTIDVPQEFDERTPFSWEHGFKSTENRSTKTQTSDSGERPSSESHSERKKQAPDKSRNQRQKTETGSGEQIVESDRRKGQTHFDRKKENQQNRSGKRVERHDKQHDHQKRSDQTRGNNQQTKGNRENGKNDGQQQIPKNVIIPPVIEKALERNKRTRKPSKGLMGMIKSFIPRFKLN